jgi:hypothetical protein
MRIVGIEKFLALALAALVSVPAIAEAGRRGGRSSGPRMSPGKVYRSGGARPGRTTRPRVRDHRGTTVRPPPRGDRPYVRRHRHYHYWPYYWGFGYWPYYGYHDGYYATYYGPPAYAEAVAPAPPRPRPVVALGLHLGQLEGDRSGNAGTAGLSVRWRGAFLEGELELGRRALHDSDVSERSLAANLYVNLGNRDRFHPYLVGGVGALEGDRVFGALGAGLAVPVASRLTLAGDLRLGSVAPREMTDARIDAEAEQTFEGRIGLLLDF